MPAAPRTDSKATKIAYKVLGKPANIAFKPTKRQRWINQRLWFEETARSR